MLAALAFILALLWLFAAMAMFAGTVLPSRGMAVAVTTGAVVAAYILHTLGLLVDSWGTARKFTPFYWADASRPLIGDYQPGWLALLVGLTAAFVIAAVFAFERRDISSGASGASWPRLVRRFKSHKRHPAAPGMDAVR